VKLAHAPAVGATVRHPLWPELGHGTVTQANRATQPQMRTGVVAWATGQISRHCLAVLVEVS
jgi:hypothetical protein